MAIIRWVGMGFEATFGTAVAAKYFVDPTRVTLDSPSDPFLLYPGASGRGNRVIVPAGYIPSGDVEAVLDHFRTGALLRGSVPGVKYMQNGITKAGANTTVDAAGVALGDTNIPVVASAGFTADDIIQIGSDLGPSELHKVVTVNSGPDSLDIEDGVHYAYAETVVVEEITAARYVHTFDYGGQENVLDPMTIRTAKDIDEQIFSGASVNSIRLSAAHNNLLTLTAAIVASKDSVGAAPSAPTGGIMSPPFASAHLTAADLDGLVSGTVDILPTIRGMDWSVSNNIANEDGMRMGSRFPTEFRGLGLGVQVVLTQVFRDRAQYDDFFGASGAPADNVVVGRDIHLTYLEDATHIVDLFIYNAYPHVVGSPITGRDQLIQSVEWRALQPLSSDNLGRVQLTTVEEHRYF